MAIVGHSVFREDERNLGLLGAHHRWSSTAKIATSAPVGIASRSTVPDRQNEGRLESRLHVSPYEWSRSSSIKLLPEPSSPSHFQKGHCFNFGSFGLKLRTGETGLFTVTLHREIWIAGRLISTRIALLSTGHYCHDRGPDAPWRRK